MEPGLPEMYRTVQKEAKLMCDISASSVLNLVNLQWHFDERLAVRPIEVEKQLVLRMANLFVVMKKIEQNILREK